MSAPDSGLDFSNAQNINTDGSEQPLQPSQLDFSKAQGVSPDVNPYDPQVHGRYTTPAGYQSWLKKLPAIGPSSKPGEYEAWVSAHSTHPYRDAAVDLGGAAVATAGGMGVAALPAAIIPTTIKGAQALTAWAAKNPTTAKISYKILEAAVSGTIAGSIIKGIKNW